MITHKNPTLKSVWTFTGGHIIWLTVWMSAVVIVYKVTHWSWMSIPWLPMSVIGTAVAFYVGFKNNQAYDRMWEGRTIWGASVNSSRSLGISVRGSVGNTFRENPISEHDLSNIHRDLIYRHIAWLYVLRKQLLQPEPWEHINQGLAIRWAAEKRMQRFGLGTIEKQETDILIKQFISDEEFDAVNSKKNAATQLIDRQAQLLKKLREEQLIDDFRHVELQEVLQDFYDHQGKAERIKKFPFPRQFGGMSMVFVGIFIFLLPFGMLNAFQEFTDTSFYWLSIPFSVLVGWIYLTMELVGDYSENPFEGLPNDVPMLALCRTIELDLREMLGETDLPEAVQPRRGILM
ncbi:hypothetical protein GYB22_03205 [bacterium]|nr:hypothetical protein [bacterium]